MAGLRAPERCAIIFQLTTMQEELMAKGNNSQRKETKKPKKDKKK
jgi:hypothetical protein